MSRKPKHGYYVKGQFVAYGSELDAELNQRDIPSKSDLKRESEALQDLGEQLLTLGASLMAKLDLPENLRDAVAAAKRITNFEGKRRQMQYIGKLMRKIDPEPIKAAVREQNEGSAAATLALHQLEQWRDHLLESDAVLSDIVARYPQTDAQHLRALVRQARKEQPEPSDVGKTQRNSKAYREIFQYLKTLLKESEDDTTS